MSDLMLIGVLRMPMDDASPLDVFQYVARGRQAADRIEADAAEIERLRERVAALEQLVIDAAYTLDKARIWGGMGWHYNPLHPIHYTPMRERLQAECAKINASRAAPATQQ